VRGNKGILSRLNRFAHDLHAYFLTGSRVTARHDTNVVAMKGALSMAFGTQDETDDVMNEINMTPLVDVMLVLLIIFIITVPVMKHAVNIDLPRASNVAAGPSPDGAAVGRRPGPNSGTRPHRRARTCARALKVEAAREPQPNCTSAATEVRYERVAQAWRGAACGHAQDRLHHRAKAN
jgi:biopolymer transport protein ExbD